MTANARSMQAADRRSPPRAHARYAPLGNTSEAAPPRSWAARRLRSARSVARREKGLASLGGASARGDLGAAADQASALRKCAERLAVAQRVQRDRDDGAEREALDCDALLRDRRRRAELNAPSDRLAVRADRGLAVVSHDLEQELRMVRAGNEADEPAGVRDLLRLVVHRERMVRMHRSRDESSRGGAQSGKAATLRRSSHRHI